MGIWFQLLFWCPVAHPAKQQDVMVCLCLQKDHNRYSTCNSYSAQYFASATFSLGMPCDVALDVNSLLLKIYSAYFALVVSLRLQIVWKTLDVNIFCRWRCHSSDEWSECSVHHSLWYFQVLTALIYFFLNQYLCNYGLPQEHMDLLVRIAV